MTAGWSRETRILFLLVLTGIISGSTYLFVRELEKNWIVFEIVAIRLAFAALFSSPFAVLRWREIRALDRRQWLHFLLISLAVGFFNDFFPYTLYPVAMSIGLGDGVVALLMGLSPLFGFFLELVFGLGAPMSGEAFARAVAAFALGLGGLAVLTLPKIFSSGNSGGGGGGDSLAALGYLLVLGAALSKAVGAVLVQRFTRGRFSAPLTTLGAVTAAAALAVGAVAPLELLLSAPAGRRHFWASVTAMDAVGVLYLALVATAGQTALQFFLVGKVGAARQMFAELLSPIVAVVEAFLFLGAYRSFTLFHAVCSVIGSIFVLSGVLTLKIWALTNRDDATATTRHAESTVL